MSTETTQNRLLAEAYGNPLIEAQGPQQNPGELANWPMLKVSYRTDKDRIASLLPARYDKIGEMVDAPVAEVYAG